MKRPSIVSAIVVAALVAAADLPAQAADPAAQAPVAAAEASGWTIQLNQETRYFDLQGSRGDPAQTRFGPGVVGAAANNGRGFQIYTPTTLSVSGLIDPTLRFDGVIRSGYVSSHQTTSGDQGGTGTFTDTVPSFTLTYLGFDGVQPFLSLSLNIPTGKPVAFGYGALGRLDPDLVDVATFGEGFNVGPTLGVNIPLNADTVLTLSGAYTMRGDYNQETYFVPGFPQITARTHPGDTAAATASLSTQYGPVTFQQTASFTHYAKSQSNGLDQLESGDQVSISTILGYAFNETYSARAIASFTKSGLNRVASAAPATVEPPTTVLTTEPFNSNSLVSSIRLEPTYARDQFTIGPVASYQRRNANSYDPATLQFVPAKQRESAGVQGTYRPTPKALFNARFERVWTQVDTTPILLLPSIAREVNIFVIGGTLTF